MLMLRNKDEGIDQLQIGFRWFRALHLADEQSQCNAKYASQILPRALVRTAVNLHFHQDGQI